MFDDMFDVFGKNILGGLMVLEKYTRRFDDIFKGLMVFEKKFVEHLIVLVQRF